MHHLQKVSKSKRFCKENIVKVGGQVYKLSWRGTRFQLMAAKLDVLILQYTRKNKKTMQEISKIHLETEK